MQKHDIILIYKIAKRRTVNYGIRSLAEKQYNRPRIVDGRIILKWIFKKWDEGHELD
jgi:hypothetical protein